MRYSECSVCKKFDFLATHKCHPAWHVWNDDEFMDDEVHTVYARDSIMAAEAAMQDHLESSEWYDMDPQTFWIREATGVDPPEKYEVYVEMTPEFSVYESREEE